MIDAVAVYGDEASVTDQLEDLFQGGVGEVLASVVTVGDAKTSAERTMRLLARVSAS